METKLSLVIAKLLNQVVCFTLKIPVTKGLKELLSVVTYGTNQVNNIAARSAKIKNLIGT